MTEQNAVNSANKPETVRWLTLAAGVESLAVGLLLETPTLLSGRTDRIETLYWLMAAQALALVGAGIGAAEISRQNWPRRA